MRKLVVHGARLKCDQGSDPSVLTVLPDNRTDGGPIPAATVMDRVPGVNIAPFGACQALGSACAPEFDDPWSPGSPDVEIAGLRALTSDSKCACTWTGSIEITDPGSEVEVDPA
jgi:hypothetical protein